jgi:hypothetical protein
MGLPAEILLPLNPVAAHRTPVGFSTVLSETGRKNVAEWYAADIEFVTWLERFR